MDNLEVSVIIVSYNTKDLLKNCINSVIKNTKDIDYEIIVVDNNSTDGSIEMLGNEFPLIKLIQNHENLGFGMANNIGRHFAKGKYVLYLNSDTLILNNAIKIFHDYWEEHDEDNLFSLGTILLDKDGNTMHSGGMFPTYSSICKWQLKRDGLNFVKMIMKLFKLNFLYNNLKKRSSKTVSDYSDVQYITGADLFMKNDENAEFDTNYFMYYEESDMQYKLFNNGMSCKLLNEPKIKHLTYKENKEIELARITDIYTEISSLYYVKKNLHHSTMFLKFLIVLDSFNPYVRAKYKIANKNYIDYMKIKNLYYDKLTKVEAIKDRG